MKHTDIARLFSNASEYVNQTVTVCGWVKTSAEVKPMTFIQLNDGTTTIRNLQLTIHQDKMSEEEYKSVIKPLLNFGVSLKATGTLIPSERNVIELEVESVEMLGDCPASYPLQKKKTSVDFLRTIPHLRTRTNLIRTAMVIRSCLAYAVHSYFHSHGYTYVHTPIITDSDCEGAGEMFRLTTQPWNASYKTEEEYFRDDYFGQKAGLSVSCQLEGEMAALGGLGRIYTFGPSFRAEKSDTPRHVAEFWHVEPEVCFADINEIMDIGEEFIVLDKLNHVVNSDFARVDYTEAVRILEESKHKFEYPVFWGCDLQTEHERYLTDVHFKRPVFVVNYPKELKAFYMKQNPDGKTVAATDLLVPGVGEIIGCSERETDYDKLVEAMQARNMPLEAYEKYLDTRKYGSVQHSGFGLGLDRLVMYVSGISNIRDVLQFPRTYKKIY